MSFEIIFIFALLIVAALLFATEKVSFDVVALIIMGSLLLSGILTPAEGLSGFSNEATITIAAMFVLSEGIRQTGALNEVGDYFSRLGKRNYWLAVGSMLLIICVISAFINNTAAVAIFIPVVVGVADEMKVSPSKLLMPLSFASMFGGVCTLIGTSTNILVSSIAEERGQAAFSMFEFTPLGLIFLVIGLLYLWLVGNRLIPERRGGEDITTSFEMNAYLTDVVLEPGFAHFDQPLNEIDLTKNLDLEVVQVFHEGDQLSAEGSYTVLKPGDVLRVHGNAQEIRKLREREDVSLKPAKEWLDVDLEQGQDTLVEVVIAPDSPLQGKTIKEVEFGERFGAIVLAIRRHGELQQDELGQVHLSGGMSLLLSMDQDRVQEVERSPSFVVASEVVVPKYRTEKMPLAIGILIAVVAAAAANLVPIVISALIGCLLLILFGCLSTEEAYEAINWKVIILLAGVLPLGLAMDKTGAAEILSSSLLTLGGRWGPIAILSAFFFTSMMLTNIISNQATAALLAPIAIEAAAALNVSGRPFLVAVTFAASLSFMTPVGYQTNTLIYGPGQYKFTDFTKVGTPLNLIFWILATLFIPLIWPF